MALAEAAEEDSVSSLGAAEEDDEDDENIAAKALNTVFFRLGSNLNIIISVFGCSYIDVGKDKEVAAEKGNIKEEVYKNISTQVV